MKTQRLALGLTVLNLALLAFTLFRPHRASTLDAGGILRCQGLEIVDVQGRRRAQIVLLPPSTTKEGVHHPETTLFRLCDPNGRPGVKIATSADGSGMSLSGDSERPEWNGIQLLANTPETPETLVKLTARNGEVHVIKPQKGE
jgi:hypothetical protein